MLRRKTDPKTGTHTLCEPAQSKCTWKSHKSHFIRKLTRKMPRPGLSPERGHTLCASLRSRNALHHFTRATLYRNLQEKCRAQDSAQNADAHFVRACAVEMHFNGSQEPIYSEIYRKNAAPKIEPRTRTHTLCASTRRQNALPHFTRDFIRNFTRKILRPRVSTLNKHRPFFACRGRRRFSLCQVGSGASVSPPSAGLVPCPSASAFFSSLSLSGFARSGLGVLVLVFSLFLLSSAFPSSGPG